MHLVSADGAAGAAQQGLFMPMLTRMPKARARMMVVCLSPNAVPGAVLRQNGVPVYDVALSRQRIAFGAVAQLVKTMRAFRPEIIHAWGYTAQLASLFLRSRCQWELKLVWTFASTSPPSRGAGLIERQKLKYVSMLAKRANAVVYTSEAAASAHRRAGFPEEGYHVVPLGVDPTRFKPDPALRRKMREQLGLAQDALVVGMMAPFQPQFDHATLLKALGELIKTQPDVCVLLAGHGVQKGNGPLMALLGSGALGARAHLLGKWSDIAAFYNACDIACSSAHTDELRTSLLAAMLCGVPCVATGMGAQGEVIGQHGVAVEPGNPTALLRGIVRVLELTPEKRAFMAQGARKHVLTNFVAVRSLQRYLQLYYDLLGRKLEAASAMPAAHIDATVPIPVTADEVPGTAPKQPDRTVRMQELADPDSLESTAPSLRPAPLSDGDVLQMFDNAVAAQVSTQRSPMAERARGVAELGEDLLAPEALQQVAPATDAANALSLSEDTSPSAAGSEPPSGDAPPSFVATTPELSLEATSTLGIPSDLIFTTLDTSSPDTASSASAAVQPTQAPVQQDLQLQLPEEPTTRRVGAGG